MADSETSRLQDRLAEDIALLFYLTRNHAPPERHPMMDPKPDTGSARTLSFRDEWLLTSTLAFLSSVRDDPSKITAVCVEECPSGLTIMLAVNAKDSSPSPYLQSVKAGIDKIFSLLRNVSTGPRQYHLERVFGAIVSTCHRKILSRARLTKAGQKPPLENVLGDLVAGLRTLSKDNNIETVATLSQSLIQRLRLYRGRVPEIDQSSPEADKDLEAIVYDFYQISKIPNIESIIQSGLGRISPDLTVPLALFDKVRKIASYWKSASTLLGIARHLSTVRQASTLAVSLGSISFSQYERTPNHFPELKETLQRITATHEMEWNMENLGSLLSKKLKTSTSFLDTLKRLKAGSKVHAEIQLVWYLRRHQSSTPPRIIAANKEACYLCNNFISRQTDYVIPGTHGRLYPGWRLPSDGLLAMNQPFIMDLERLAIRRINQVLNNEATEMKDPTESRAPSTIGTSSTVLTVENGDPEESQVSDSDDTVVPEREHSYANGLIAKPQNATGSSAQEADDQETFSHPPSDQAQSIAANLVSSLAVSAVSSVHGKEEESVAVQEKVKWRDVKSGDVGHFRLSDSVSLYIEYTTKPPTSASKNLRFIAKRLSAEETTAALSGNLPIYDLSSLNEVACGTGCDGLMLRLDGQMFRVDLEAFGTKGEK
ncbi:hypothetical protein BGZ61DRAFT_525664 [Ilyonectria robusta]|uniref:uncharacterized protein n=1 Tax=Ilyonectria robusta TaxID=1079257 RepID=UPI001E8D7B43|nr:uncharacterized protein BGZ61DRAFT_525664 [Ilyonectria robusta]KAH8737557.1 hypothetical protein BGZ61DRAFT_525664 [Ilyonectria robusta]